VDFGTVTASLIEGRYQTVDAFANDCRLIISNCVTYYEGREDGKVYSDQATRLNECLSQQLDQLTRYDKSPKAVTDRTKAKEIPAMPKPAASLLRSLKYTDKATRITQAAMGPFEDPVSLVTYPDYAQFIREKMDLQTIERKVKSNGYEVAEDFEYDVNLVFRNYEEYHARRHLPHAGAIAKFAARKFRQIFVARIRSGSDDPTFVLPFKMERQDSIATLSMPQADKTISSASPSSVGKKAKQDNAKKKAVPRISITSSSVTALPSPTLASAARSKSPGPKKQVVTTSAPLAKLKFKPNQPVPLHIAIARVKEGFPIRRAVKTLQSWEADCARYFKELMRHPWISAARPKFIFHVPVPVLFPDLCDTYAAKIKNPMDLTTIECSLVSRLKDEC
jgi:Bromodomain